MREDGFEGQPGVSSRSGVGGERGALMVVR
jgi:hypothetical protein